MLKPLLAVGFNQPDMLKTLNIGLDLMMSMASDPPPLEHGPYTGHRPTTPPASPCLSRLPHLASAPPRARSVLGALYPMYWDSTSDLTMVMYVPGWAILWSLVWMAATTIACFTLAYRAMRAHNRLGGQAAENCVLGCLATSSCCYWVWFLYVPLLVYACYFAQGYAELVTAQVRVCGAYVSKGVSTYVGE